MYRFILILILNCTTIIGSAQNFNLELLGRLQYEVELSDIWGYVDDQGNEYALVGLHNNFSVVNVSDPANPVEVFRTDSANSSDWRDIKTWADYAYVTCECGPGLMILDLSPLPESTNLPYHYWNGDTAIFFRAHNLFIDEHGIAYVFGADYSFGGAIILDLNSDPNNPEVLGIYDENYLHDGVVRNDTLWGSAVNEGELQVIDVKDKKRPKKIVSWKTPGVFTHNAWISSSGRYVFTTDEIKNGRIAAYDVYNIFNSIETDSWIVNDTAIIPHNTHWKDDFLITSYYTYGLNIIDVSRPWNMVEVGHYDTSPDFRYEGFSGCWGVYPWLPSGNIIASDIEEGLYVFKPTYKRGAYVEGRVTDEQTGKSIFFPTVEIVGSDTFVKGSIGGDYAIATLSVGIVDIAFSVADYYPDTARGVILENGVVTELDMKLSKWPTGMESIADDESLSVYPNPNTGSFCIENNGEFDRVSIYSGEGEIVYENKLDKGCNLIHLNSSGVYVANCVRRADRRLIRKEIVVR